MSTTFVAVGRRKTSSARVRMSAGSGKIMVNKKPIEDYFPRAAHRFQITEPLKVSDLMAKYDISANVRGGGQAGQAGAIRLGIARALVKIDEELRRVLKPHGIMTRDPRMKERRKYGLAKARKRFQFSKR
ncbi:MAG: 30S ribosomal protein S9 [Bacteroidetes bacterium]|nr:30S ribosomal protein S9 [Bacteroidota bacterium]